MDIDNKTNPHTEHTNYGYYISYFRNNTACGVNDEWTYALVRSAHGEFTVDNDWQLGKLTGLLKEVYAMGQSHLKLSFQRLMGLQGEY